MCLRDLHGTIDYDVVPHHVAITHVAVLDPGVDQDEIQGQPNPDREI